MAPISKAQAAATNDLQQRVTALDRSTEHFSIQIAEAYSLLNVDFDSAGSTYSQAGAEEEARIGFTPKEQWVLRWLLKRFEGDTVQVGSPCSEPKAWILLRIVVARLPLTVTARLLSAHKFMSTVQKTLDWLYSYISNDHPVALASNDEHLPKAPRSRESSSSTTVQEMPRVASKKSKKRKRGQPDSESLTAEEVPVLDPILLYIAICGALSQIEVFTNDKPGEAENFAIEHIKAAIKTPIEQSAKILGNSLNILAQIISVPNNSSQAVNYNVFLRSAVDVWSLRSTFQETRDDSISAQAFSIHCLVPALRLLLRLHCTSFQNDSIIKIAHATQKLIAAHVILPARTAFMRGKDPDSDESRISMITELLGPLSKVVILETQDPSPVAHESSMMNTIPMFFEYALKLLPPQNTPKKRMTEAPWLRALFIQLTECLSLPFPLSKVATPSESVLDTLESLLHLLVENDVSMDIPILESFVLYLSGIYPVEGQHRARWSLVGLCMEISPDLAIPVRSNSNVRTGRATSKSNMVLNRILDKLTDSGFKYGHETSSDYYIMLNTVVLRLLKSFINARDLLGFLNIWEQQIGLSEIARVLHSGSGRYSILAASIWENEALLQKISEQLEQVLTAGQISKLLDGLGSRIANDSNTLAINPLEPYAQVVVLDCALNGVRSNTVISTCKISIESIGRKLATVLKNNDALFVPHRWRIWRVLATIASRFLYYQDDLFRHAQDEIALSLAKESSNLHFSAYYYAAPFALGFVISAQEAQKISNQNGERSGVLCNVIRVFVECIQSVPPPDGKKDLNQVSHWNGKRETIITRLTLLLACAAQLTSGPKVLSEIEYPVLDLFLRMIYRHAAHGAYMSDTPKGIHSGNTSITFVDVWEELVEIGMAGEYPPITRAIRHIAYDAFVQTGPIGKTRIRTEEEEYAVFVICRMSLGAFEREQREDIIRHVSDKLLEGTSLPGFSQYLALLVRSLDYPKKSMHLLSDPAYLWNLADLVDSDSEGPVSSSGLISFRQLAAKAINIVISDCAERKSTILDPFLDHLEKRSLASACEPVSLAKSTLRAVSLKLLWRRCDALPEQLKSRSPSLIDTCQELFEWLPQCLTQWEAGQEDWVLTVILDTLETCLAMLESGLFKAVSEIQKSNTLSQINQISEWSKTLALQKSLPLISTNTTVYSIEDLVVAAKKIEAGLSPQGPVMTTMVNIAAIKEFTTVRARQAWVQYLAESLWKLDEQKQANLVTQLTNMDFTNESTLHYVLRILDHTYAKIPNMKSALAQLFFKICIDLHQISSTRCCILEMHCLDLMMKKNSWVVSQWHIDSLLSTITIMTARPHNQPHTVSPDIFTCLCRLFGTILALHRSKLGGRYHLVVLALQGLLHCFFTPYTSRPPTLPILNPTHASAYTRLLTSLCDPSVSAVTRSKTRQRAELNDATKKARSIAGQHLQYLIMDFCVCQLKGRMQPDVRTALNPGLYAIFDAMSQDVMRTVNAAFDVGGRAIFKVVYEDYRRFGRWKGG